MKSTVRAAEASPNPGATVLHRLNRTEYGNAIRELLDLNVDVTTLLPADDSAEGFDNIADVLRGSPTLIQGYLSAAMKISRLAVGDSKCFLPDLLIAAAGKAKVFPPGLREEFSFVTHSARRGVRNHNHNGRRGPRRPWSNPERSRLKLSAKFSFGAIGESIGGFGHCHPAIQRLNYVREA